MKFKDITLVKTGDIFYYEDHTPHLDKIHRHRCRVLFVGVENIFYDAWWDTIDKWTFVPVKEKFTYYRFPLTHLHRLIFDGFEEINAKSAEKLFLQSPEILLRTTKEEISNYSGDNHLINVNSSTIAFVPIGPKAGWLKPFLFETMGLTVRTLIDKVLQYQNLDFIKTEDIVIDRIGLHSGVPSYTIRVR